MAAEPAEIIRTLRTALGMSRAEFARAAGWAPSTISSWERGKTKPNRLALKTVLAFAQERGVRYRPQRNDLALITPSSGGPRPTGQTFHAAHGTHAAHEDAYWVEMERSTPALRPSARIGETSPPLRAIPDDAEGARWRAEAHFKMSLGRPSGTTSTGHSTARVVGTLALSACVVMILVGRPGREHPAVPAGGVRPTTAMPALALAESKPQGLVATGAAVPAGPSGEGTLADAAASDDTGPAKASAGTAAGQRVAAATPPETRLESVVVIGANRRATFRTAGDPRTVFEGETVGAHRVVTIEPDRVTLIDTAGGDYVVRLGQSFPAK